MAADVRLPGTPRFANRAKGWGTRHKTLVDNCRTLCRITTMGHKELRPTSQTLKVLATLMASPNEELSGADIGRTTKLASGTLYPILMRLEQAGWVESRWETGEPSLLGRPRRRLYQMTALGARSARSAFEDITRGVKELAWQS